MKIYVGADHNGFQLKKNLTQFLADNGYSVEDIGDEVNDPDDDFTVFTARVVNAMKSSDDTHVRGILICGSGQGMMMAANRFKGIRAGLGWSVDAAKSVRNDEDSNILALPAEIFDKNTQWQDIVNTWLTTPFAGAARYIRRNIQLDELS